LFFEHFPCGGKLRVAWGKWGVVSKGAEVGIAWQLHLRRRSMSNVGAS